MPREEPVIQQLAEKMHHAARYGTREEFVEARVAWFREATKGECADCERSDVPLHRWLGDPNGDRVCEPCDRERRDCYELWLDEQSHRNSLRWGGL